jgi:8-oxo-dGTP pyrophosphatase MutT (NUDIX family)
MPSETSSGAIIFRKEEGKVLYLLLHYESGHWDFPKGHIEQGEDEFTTARREAQEETGLEDIVFLPDFEEKISYFYTSQGRKVFKTVVFLLAETGSKEIKISEEHLGFKWLPFQEALEQITFENAKEVLKKADKFLSEKGV